MNQLLAAIAGLDQMLATGEGKEIPMQRICRTMKGNPRHVLGVPTMASRSSAGFLE